MHLVSNTEEEMSFDYVLDSARDEFISEKSTQYIYVTNFMSDS